MAKISAENWSERLIVAAMQAMRDGLFLEICDSKKSCFIRFKLESSSFFQISALLNGIAD